MFPLPKGGSSEKLDFMILEQPIISAHQMSQVFTVGMQRQGAAASPPRHARAACSNLSVRAVEPIWKLLMPRSGSSRSSKSTLGQDSSANLAEALPHTTSLPNTNNKRRKNESGGATAHRPSSPPPAPSDSDSSEPAGDGRLLLGLAESRDSWSTIGVAPWLVAQCTSMGLQVHPSPINYNRNPVLSIKPRIRRTLR